MFLKSDAIVRLKKGFIAFEITAIKGNETMAIGLFDSKAIEDPGF
jgi:hypothetical protein